MSDRNYGQAISVLESDNKLSRIEKLNKSIDSSLPCLGITYNSGTLLMSHVWDTESELMNKSDLDFVFKISDEVGAGFAGRSADARKLINDIKDFAIDDIKKYGGVEDADYIVKQISGNIEDINLELIYRPMGVSLLIGGYDGRKKPCLYCVEPSGNITSWKAYTIGRNSSEMNAYLESKYDSDMSSDDAFDLAINCLDKYNDIKSPDDLQGVFIENDEYREIKTDDISEKLNSGENQ